ncbi:NAD(P)-dependent oxidoreductase [Catenuloplanes japonicus]|uniref:NAD(P)-dependent oxidoreductase n=1 Tax=Catenuloplanes japonicus TaxID=33876 RepID=UPI000526E44B|nr:NAD(P)-binding oxidoreductase [Catenuloplanes japonicus]
MRIVVLGATGATGRHVVRHALDRGHDVIALARDPETLSGLRAARLEVRKADVHTPVSVVDAAADADGVISALGFSRGGPRNTLSTGARAVADAKRPRVVWLGSFGVGASRRFSSGLHERIQRLVLGADGYDDKILADSIIEGPDVTIVHPVSLTNGPLTEARVVPLETLDRRWRVMPPSISRAAVAAAMVSELENPAHAGRTVAVF